jgi:ABC-type nickel/cobalt efflux system permease component RcnA
VKIRNPKLEIRNKSGIPMTETGLSVAFPLGPRALFLLALAALSLPASPVAAHPVPKNTHDRTVVVHLVPGARAGTVDVRINYRLEVDEWTVFEVDLKPYAEEIDAFEYRGKPLVLYSKFAEKYGPDLAFRLHGRANGKRLEFRCAGQKATLHDEEGKPLGHLRCDFAFEASFPVQPGENQLVVREHCYLGEEGKLDLSLAADAAVPVRSKVEPDEAIKKRSPLEREPGDDDKLREVRVAFLAPGAVPTAEETPPPAPAPRAAEPVTREDDHALWRLLLHTDYGFWLTMLMALAFGAAHALTPGHGKTLVAAYLVGERGTVWHAVVLGVITTLTHTGVVLVIAAALFFLPAESRDSFGRVIHQGLGLGMGLLVTCLGFWLLLQRLSGRADHFHVGGGHHHHHHHGGQESGVRSQDPDKGSVRWGGLIVLGITGGLVPCWDAIYLLLFTVGNNQFLIALPAVLAFSAGLAGVLVLIGVLVVQVPHFARSRWGQGRLVRALPIVSAAVVTVMGLWLCYEGVHGR